MTWPWWPGTFPVDILAISKDRKRLLVVELKKGRASDSVVGQIMRYMGYLQEELAEPGQTVEGVIIEHEDDLINWREPLLNDFAIAEEVSLHGGHERRPDLVLYVNGIAIGVLELKNSRVDIGEGIRQNWSNQTAEFNAWFFSTIQFVFVGNDSKGLRYGTIGRRRS